MFIYSIKSTTLKFFGIVGVAILTLVALIFLVPSYSEATTKEIATMNENISFDNIKRTKARKNPCLYSNAAFFDNVSINPRESAEHISPAITLFLYTIMFA